MKEKLVALEREALAEIEKASTRERLEALRIQYLGRRGSLSSLLKELGQMPPEERPEAGQWANRLKGKIEAEIHQKLASLSQAPSTKAFFDRTLPGHILPIGTLHPLTQVLQEICDIFVSLGFRIVEGPEIETERYNFDALNIPKNHPSRDTFDTFYLDRPGTLLRSQTSTVQIRVMEKEKLPLRIVAPGRVFRPDAVDASHSFMFHQVEGLWVDETVAFSDLKGVCPSSAAGFLAPRPKSDSGLIIFPSPNRVQRSISPASYARGRDAGSAPRKGGWRSWGRGWCTRMCFVPFGSIRNATAGLPLDSGLSGSPC